MQYLTATLEDFKTLLNRVADGFETREAFAKALGINSSRLSRALNTGDFPFNVTNCLRLAKVSGESATEILRAAGKADVAALIEELYGKQSTLSADERQTVAFIRALPREAREGLDGFIRGLAAHEDRKDQRRRKAG